MSLVNELKSPLAKATIITGTEGVIKEIISKVNAFIPLINRFT